MTRLRIVSESERVELDTPPLLNSHDRKLCFNVPKALEAVLGKLRSEEARIRFLLRLGYFKVTGRFYAGRFHQDDLDYVVSKLGILPGMIDLDNAEDRATSARQEKLILEYLGFCEWGPTTAAEFIDEVRTMVRSQLRPKLVMLRLIERLRTKKIEVPTSRTLSDLIAVEIKNHRSDLVAAVDDALSPEQHHLLDSLLEKQSGDGGNPRYERYKLTLLKRLSQSTKPGQIKSNVDDVRTLRQVFEPLGSVLARLDLSQDGLRYYAYSVIKSQVFQVSRRSDEDRYLHLVCFVANQFYRAQDTLIDAFLLCVQTTMNTSTREHKEAYYEGRTKRRQAFRKLASAVKAEAFDPLAAIEQIAFCSHMSDPEKVDDIQKVLTTGKTKRTAVEECVKKLGANAEAPENAGYYNVLESKSLKLQNRVAELIKEVDFETSDSPALMEAVDYFKDKGGHLGQSAPTRFLDADQRKAIQTEDGKLRVSLYKVLLFISIANGIKSGALNIRHCYKYRPLDNYMIDKVAWQSQREIYLQRAELAAFDNCCSTLATLAQALDNQFYQTNNAITAGENLHFHRHNDGSYHVTTPGADKEETEPLARYLSQGQCVPTLEILATVNKLTRFLNDFQHWQLRYNKPKPPDRTFFAGIIAFGSFIGIRKMARISKLISEPELENTVNWYFSLENVHAVNDRVLQFMAGLDLPEVYRRQPGLIHTSSDGQKHEVVVDSLNANYSFKYLGKEKGVSSHGFTDERHFNFHSDVISSAEKEAAYVIDGVMHNEVVKSDIHSTDTAGYSEVIFGAMHLLGFTFAPRIKSLKKQQLYSFANRRRNDYAEQGYSVLPDGYINFQLIEPHWEEVLRFIATIKLKVTTASQLFRRLNSYSKQHPLWKALKEFGKIIKTRFILQYIDDALFRQAIEKQLNKSESSNKFSIAISLGRKQFLYGDKVEQEIAENCRRLIKNCIICWNYLVLSRQVLGEGDQEQKVELLEAIRNGSVAAWGHINLQGEFDFSDEKMQDSVGLTVPKKPLFDAA